MSDIQQRLQEAHFALKGQLGYSAPATDLYLEAATAIRSLTEQRDEALRVAQAKEVAARAYYDNYREEEARAAALTARVGELEAALRTMRMCDSYADRDGWPRRIVDDALGRVNEQSSITKQEA